MPFIQDNSVQPLNPQERKAATAAKKAGGFFQRLGEDLNKRKQNVMSDAKEFSQGKISSQEYRVRGAGQVAGGFTDVVGNVVGTAAKVIVKASFAFAFFKSVTTLAADSLVIFAVTTLLVAFATISA